MEPSVVRLPRSSTPTFTLPDPLHLPDQAAAAVLRAWEEVADMDRDEIAVRMRAVTGMAFITRAILDAWLDGLVMPTLDVTLVLAAVVGPQALAVLWSLPRTS